MKDSDTIYASITGRQGSVCVYRLSGVLVKSVLSHITKKSAFKGRYFYKVSIFDENGTIIDPSALVVLFPAPNSYTGEDVAEVHLHASDAVIKAFCHTLHIFGLRLATAGEFSKRAVLNGKMTLKQAIGVKYLIESKTILQYRAAVSQMTGKSSQSVNSDWENVSERLLLIISHAEACLEFSDEDDTINDSERSLTLKISQLIVIIQDYLDLYQKRSELRQGIPVVLVGPPNVGKSSLLNALARYDCAIVSDIAGTTRDTVQVILNWGGYAIRLIDTAGLRDTVDPIEIIGIEKTKKYEEQSIITILLLDNETLHLYDDLRKKCLSPNIITVLNKNDIVSFDDTKGFLTISAKTGDGLLELENLVENILNQHYADCIESSDFGDEIYSMLQSALIGLNQALDEKMLEIKVQILYDLFSLLQKMVPAIDAEDVLDRIFSQFCIGK